MGELEGRVEEISKLNSKNKEFWIENKLINVWDIRDIKGYKNRVIRVPEEKIEIKFLFDKIIAKNLLKVRKATDI